MEPKSPPPLKAEAKFRLGQIVRHRSHPFRGVVFDVDPVFSNSEEWYEKIATSQPRKDQPWYHLLAEGADLNHYTAYVSEQNLTLDDSDQPVNHPELSAMFDGPQNGFYRLKLKVN